MKKGMKILSFGVLAFILGAAAGAVVWVILKVMNIGINLIWELLPEKMGLENCIIYNIVACLVGGLIIGLWQRRYGPLPENMEQVMGRIKREGFYPYDKLHIIAVSALLPLIFGGTLGPEAGLTGLIVGLCYFVGDRLKYKADEVNALAETGMAAALGVIFGAPLFGIVGNLEPDNWSRSERRRLADKKTRVFLYIMGVLGGLAVMMGLGMLTGSSGGLPRFDMHHQIGLSQWKWFPVLLIMGVIFGLLYLTVDRITYAIGKGLQKYRIVSCMIAGLAVAVLGYFLPLTMFSGEHQMGELMDLWQDYSVTVLLLSAIGKILLVNLCINLGWRGGNIFPLIFAGTMVGYAMAAVVGMNGSVAVAVTVASLYAYIMRKPLTVAAVLLLCFPVTYIIPVLAAAFITSKVPVPSVLLKIQDGKHEKNDEVSA